MADTPTNTAGAPLPQDIVSGVAIGNLKSISEQPAMLSNLSYSNIVSTTNLSHQNAVSNQQKKILSTEETGV